jgi:hypothetical protein
MFPVHVLLRGQAPRDVSLSIPFCLFFVSLVKEKSSRSQDEPHFFRLSPEPVPKPPSEVSRYCRPHLRGLSGEPLLWSSTGLGLSGEKGVSKRLTRCYPHN